jgi:hypothetical protein
VRTSVRLRMLAMPTMSMPHSCIDPGRSNRWKALLGFFRGLARNSP